MEAITIDIVDIKKCLCYYDKRNPDNVLEDDEVLIKTNCSCDNCFYGRTKLAEFALQLIEFKKNINI